MANLFPAPKYKAFDNNGDPLNGGKVNTYEPGTVTRKTTYTTAAGTIANTNPVILNARGEADIWWVGTYKVVVTDADDNVMYSVDNYDNSGFVTYATKAAVKAIDFDSSSAGQKIFITSADGGEFTVKYNATPGTYADDGGSYCGTQFIPTGGDGTIGIVRDDVTEINVKWFGADPSATATVNTTAFQSALNYLSNNDNIKLRIPPGTYSLDDDLYAYYDVTNNPGFNSGTLQGGRITIEGDGKMHRQDWKNDTFKGTVLSFANDKGLKLGNSGTQKTWTQQWSNLSVVGNHSGKLIDANFLPSYSHIHRLFVGNNNTAGTGTAFYVADTWVSHFQDIECIGDKDLVSGATHGEGFVFEPVTAGGGNNVFQNITCAYFSTSAQRFGHDYDAGKTALDYLATNHLVLNCQGQYSDVGVMFKHGFEDSTIIGQWCEHNNNADVTIDNSSRNLKFINGRFNSNVGTGTGAGLVVLGDDSATATTDACYGVSFEGSWFFLVSPGIRKHPGAVDIKLSRCQLYNGGSCLISADANDGGEITLEENNYYPEPATSELPSARRHCQVTAGPTYTDTSELLRRSDFRVNEVTNGTFDMSSWRYAAEEIRTNSLSGNVTINLPGSLSSAVGRLVETRIMKPNASNDVIIDAGTGYTINGGQTLVLSAAYTTATVRHAGSGSVIWDLIAGNDSLRTTATTTELADITDTINTRDKYVGKRVYNTTTTKPVYAVGSGAGAVWNDATGTLAHTPV